MKQLENKVAKHEAKAKRTLARRQAKKLLLQATRFRCDALTAGYHAQQLGAKVYSKHPVFEELILPLLEEAARIAANAGFDILYQTRTPVDGEPNFTHAFGGFKDEKSLTPTMKACVDLIKERPVINGTDGFGNVECQPKPAE